MILPVPVPAFQDNYIWLVADPSLSGDDSHPDGTVPAGSKVIIIDPGAAAPVQQYLAAHDLHPCAILVTHHHYDHVDGIAALCRQYAVPVYGPANSAIPGLSHPLQDHDVIDLDNGMQFRVIATPGHTLDHLCYYTPGLLFCGDTLFVAGCGRLFEGSPAQMFDSLSRLTELPPDTRVYCTHEYTLSNLEFARQVEPGNSDISTRLEQVRQLRSRNQPSVPSTLALELQSNPFLRCSEPAVMAAASQFAGRTVSTAVETFKVIRFWKDSW